MLLLSFPLECPGIRLSPWHLNQTADPAVHLPGEVVHPADAALPDSAEVVYCRGHPADAAHPYFRVVSFNIQPVFIPADAVPCGPCNRWPAYTSEFPGSDAGGN